MKKYLKPLIASIVLAATILAFIYYFTNHPQALNELRHIPPLLAVLLLVLYGVFLLTLVGIQSATLALCDTKLETKENFLLTIYSSIVNFFGPLQSGPGFRAVYLRKRHGTKLKNYTLATLFYYGFFALFSGVFLISGIFGWWVLVLLGIAIICMPFALRIPHPFIQKLRSLHLSKLYWLALATAGQVFTVAVIYFAELRSVDASISFHQAIIYTGAANFALFVSLTPGAIGFRESFLLLAQRLHHIDSANVLQASLIDRAAYVAFLGILFAIAISMHAKSFLQVKRASAASPATNEQ